MAQIGMWPYPDPTRGADGAVPWAPEQSWEGARAREGTSTRQGGRARHSVLRLIYLIKTQLLCVYVCVCVCVFVCPDCINEMEE